MASDGAEVADDYRLALEDLSSNMRFEISNLTVIARENTEHALAIAEVLQQHILKAPPSKKLPALYVMDSIVKNVGTPYTLYFGRNLFKTFMESYAVVDHGVRRKMEEMLKTWKDPVPGSMDTRPVFAHELVRPIENALMKARAASMPQQAQGPIPSRSRPNMFPHRDTPTPPGGRGYPGPVAGYPQQQSLATNGGQTVQQQQMPFHPSHSATPQSHGSTPVPVPFQAAAGPPSGAYASAGAVTSVGISVENLSNDIQTLIVAMKAEFSQNPHDASVQNRLRALLDLQGVVQHTNLPADQLELIKDKVTELAVTLRGPSASSSSSLAHHHVPAAHPPAPVHVSQTPPVSSLSHMHAAALPTPPPPNISVTPTAAPAGAADLITLDSLLGKGAMATLLSMQSAISKPPAPTSSSSSSSASPPFGNVAIRSPQPAAAQEEPLKMASAFSLLEQLRAAGMLPASTPTNASATARPPPSMPMPLPPQANLPGLPLSVASFLAAQKKEATPDVMFDVAALKQQFRPEAISALYDELGPPCTQCGRRFRTDEEGKRKKTAHMDWHFKVHQRSTEAEKRGTHRSWYVDQQDWRKAREAVDAIHDVSGGEQAAPTEKEASTSPYIPVPDPSSGINNVCPICQDRFENKWLDTVQEWVWLDTVLVGRRAYHASCHAEATRDREGTPVMRRTPEPVLGKRKAEGGLGSPKMRIQKAFI